MLKVQSIYQLIIFLVIFCGCNRLTQKSEENSKTDSSYKEYLDDTSTNHGLTLDLDYEKFPKEKLKPIIEKLLDINSTKNWTAIKKIDLDGSTEGGEAMYYYKDAALKKVIAKHYGETGKRISEYYLNKDKLIFVFRSAYTYNRPIYFDSSKMKELNDTEVFDVRKSEIVEDRSYFENGVLIHQSNNQDCGSPFSEKYLNEEQKSILTDFENLTRVVNLKK